jgi:hypothetical protein
MQAKIIELVNKKAKEMDIDLSKEYLLIPFKDGFVSMEKHEEDTTFHIEIEVVDNINFDMKDESLDELLGGIVKRKEKH